MARPTTSVGMPGRLTLPVVASTAIRYITGLRRGASRSAEWYTEGMADVAQTQKALNHFTDKYLDGINHVKVDGKKGYATRRRIRWVKYYLGYAGVAGKQNSVVNKEFLERLWPPKDPRYSTPARIARGMQRRSAQRRDWKKNHQKGPTTGVGR